MIEIPDKNGQTFEIASQDNGNNTYTYSVFYNKTLLFVKCEHTDRINNSFMEGLKLDAERILRNLWIDSDNRPFIRAVSLDNPNDPYYLTHPNESELGDERLAKLRAVFLAADARRRPAEDNEDLEEAEVFERFLVWLTTQKGFISLSPLDLLYEFEK